MRTTLAFIVACWALLQIGCTTVRAMHYNLEMTREEGIVFIGFVCETPSEWTGDRSSKDAIINRARRIIDAELRQCGFQHMTINVEDPMRYEGSVGYVQLLAYAGDLPLEELIAKTKKIIAADPLGKRRPKPFYHAKGQANE